MKTKLIKIIDLKQGDEIMPGRFVDKVVKNGEFFTIYLVNDTMTLITGNSEIPVLLK